jgi:hypothetical protein
MFVDAFKRARAWQVGTLSEGPTRAGEPLQIDDRGNVLALRAGESAVTYLFTDAEGHYPGGRYTVDFEGAGDLEWGGDAVVVSEEPGKFVLDVKPRNGLQLELTRTDPKDPIRSIRVLMPGFEERVTAPLFHPEQATNDSPLTSWSQRPRPGDATQTTRRGVALEHLVDLANELRADPWFSMPHRADDDFVRSFARLVRDRLQPELKIHVEYSNEVWNTQFQQAQYARGRGIDLGLSRDPYEAQLRYYSQRSVEIFRIWEEVFEGRERIVRVLGSHFADPWVSETVMAWRNAYERADALAVAPYFGRRFSGPETAGQVRTSGPERLIQACHGEVEGAVSKIQTLANRAMARGLRLIAYEAGQHLVGWGGIQHDAALTELFTSTNRHPDMRGLYRRYLASWHENGGGLLMLFSFVSRPGKWGSWGLLEWQDQPRRSAPKYDAVMDYVEASCTRSQATGATTGRAASRGTPAASPNGAGPRTKSGDPSWRFS